ncbi:MAG: hypothetical protein ACE5SW_01640 [Nitrososphaeraceae archaeon]
MEKASNDRSRDFDAFSPTLSTKYGREASFLLKTITINFRIIIGILMGLILLVSIDLSADLGLKSILSDELLDLLIIIISIIILFIVITILKPIRKYRNLMDKWINLFERNSLATELRVMISNRDKKEVLTAISSILEPINTKLHPYLENKQIYGKFFDIQISDGIFNILIDQTNVNDNKELSQELSQYGGIIVNIYDKIVDEFVFNSFIKHLKRYSQKNKIGITIIIAEDISEEVYDIISSSADKVINKIILVEKSNIVI